MNKETPHFYVNAIMNMNYLYIYMYMLTTHHHKPQWHGLKYVLWIQTGTVK